MKGLNKFYQVLLIVMAFVNMMVSGTANSGVLMVLCSCVVLMDVSCTEAQPDKANQLMAAAALCLISEACCVIATTMVEFHSPTFCLEMFTIVVTVCLFIKARLKLKNTKE